MATIKVMSAGAVQAMVSALGAEFELATGHMLDLNFGTAGGLRERFEGGEVPDLLILSASFMSALDKDDVFVAGSRTDLGRTVTGVATKEGAKAPDISTPEAFKQALLDARGVSYTDPKAGGSSGNFFAALLQKLGIADAVNKKAVLGKRGYEVAQAVADGRAEIGTTFISELFTVKGVTVLGPLPGELHNVNTYTAAIPAAAPAKAEAALLLHALTNPANAARWVAAGLEPAFS
jgi:molybdate transport system substrate-binding protein